MHQNDNDVKKPVIDPPCTAYGIPRRTFLKGMLATGAMTSLSALGVMDLRWAEAAGSAGERNLYQKIIAAHLGSGEMKAGSEIGLIVDSTLTQDGLGVMTYLQYEAIGIPRVKTKLSVSYVDHQTLQDGFENADDHRYLESVTDKYGILHSRPGNGICHQLHLERFSQPGWTLLGGDSHTPTGGAVGMLAIGAGGLDVAVVMGGGQFYLSYPKVLQDQPEQQAQALGVGQGHRPGGAPHDHHQGERGLGDRVRRHGPGVPDRAGARGHRQHGRRDGGDHLHLPERRGDPAVLQGPAPGEPVGGAEARPRGRRTTGRSTSTFPPSSPTWPCPTPRTT